MVKGEGFTTPRLYTNPSLKYEWNTSRSGQDTHVSIKMKITSWWFSMSLFVRDLVLCVFQGAHARLSECYLSVCSGCELVNDEANDLSISRSILPIISQDWIDVFSGGLVGTHHEMLMIGSQAEMMHGFIWWTECWNSKIWISIVFWGVVFLYAHCAILY